MTSRVSRIWLLRFYPSSDGWSFQRSWGFWTFTFQRIDDQQKLTNNKLDSYCNTSNSNNDEGCGRIQTGVCAASRCFKWAKHFHVLYIYSVNTQVPSYLMVSGPLSGCLWKWFVHLHVFLLHIVSSVCVTGKNSKWERFLVVFREYWGCSRSWATLSSGCEWASSLWDQVLQQTRNRAASSLVILMVWILKIKLWKNALMSDKKNNKFGPGLIFS